MSGKAGIRFGTRGGSYTMKGLLSVLASMIILSYSSCRSIKILSGGGGLLQIPHIVLLSAMFVLVVASITTAEVHAYTVDPTLIQTVREYAAETYYGAEHVERWNRVLDAFGVKNHTSSMTAAEAQEMADNFSPKRWNPIVAALAALEQAQQQQPQVVEEPIQYRVDSTLVATVQSYAAETHYGDAHVERWNRVLDAFGVLNHTSSMTAAEAQEMADNFSAKRWNPIVEALTALEEAKKQDHQQQQDQQQSQQQQGALENPQYAQQQDQLPSTQQSQQQNQAIIDEYREVRTHVQNILDAMREFNLLAYNNRIENPDVWVQVRDLHAHAFELGRLITVGDIYEQSNNFGALSNQITKIKTVIPRAEDILAQMRALFDPYSHLESCPQINPTTNKKLVQYIEAEVVYSETVRRGGDPLPDGARVSNSNSTHISYTYTDGTPVRNLTERICAYHDLNYGENHRGMIKEAMLALGINPETHDDVTPMSAERAFEMQQRYDNSQYDWPDGDGWPEWQERIWQDIKTEIRKIENNKYYEENKD